MDAGEWALLLFLLTLVAIGGATALLARKLNRIDKAVETANGILLGALADRQQASIVDDIPLAHRTRSQQAYVDRRDADDERTRTEERREDFKRGGESEQGR